MITLVQPARKVGTIGISNRRFGWRRNFRGEPTQLVPKVSVQMVLVPKLYPKVLSTPSSSFIETSKIDYTLRPGASNTVSKQEMDETLWLDEVIDSADRRFMRRAVL